MPSSMRNMIIVCTCEPNTSNNKPIQDEVQAKGVRNFMTIPLLSLPSFLESLCARSNILPAKNLAEMDLGVTLHKPITSLTRFLSPKEADSLRSPAPAAPAAHTHILRSPTASLVPPAPHRHALCSNGRSATVVHATNLQGRLPALTPHGLTQVLCFPQLLIRTDENGIALLNLLK